jgi:hypothetical protein
MRARRVYQREFIHNRPYLSAIRDRLIIRNFPEFSLGAESAWRLNTPMHQARYETPADHDFADSQRITSLSLVPTTMGVSSLMNDIELACLLLPRGKG